MPRRQQTVADLADWWLATAMRPPFVARYMARQREAMLRNYVIPYVGNVKLDAVDSGTVARWQRALFERKPALAHTTVRTAVRTVFGSMWSAGRREGWVKGSPTAELRWPRPARELPDAFSLLEVEQICGWFRARSPQYGLFVELLAWTGARPSEIAALEVGDYDPATGRLSIRAGLVKGERTGCKTPRSVRTIVLARRLRDLLDRRLADRTDPKDSLVTAPRGGPIDANRFATHAWRQCLDSTGLRYRKLYSLRHSYISAALTAGAPTQGVADYCGTSPQMLQQHYARWMRSSEGDPLSLARDEAIAARSHATTLVPQNASIGWNTPSVSPRNPERFEAQSELFPPSVKEGIS